MPQNTVQSTNVLFAEDNIIYIASYSTSMTNDSYASLSAASWINLGAISEFSRESKIDSVQPPSINVEHQQYISRMAETINITIQELSQTNYSMLMGAIPQSVTVSGTSTSTIDTYTAGSVSTAVEKFIPFKQQSWSSTSGAIPIEPTGIVVSGSSTFVNDVSYRIAQNDHNNWGIFVISTGGYTSTMALSLAYSFVPKAASVLYHGGADKLTPFMMKVYSIYADNRTITTYYPRVEYVSGGSINDKSGNSGEFKDMKFTLEAREHESYTYSSKKIYRIDIQTTV